MKLMLPLFLLLVSIQTSAQTRSCSDTFRYLIPSDTLDPNLALEIEGRLPYGILLNHGEIKQTLTFFFNKASRNLFFSQRLLTSQNLDTLSVTERSQWPQNLEQSLHAVFYFDSIIFWMGQYYDGLIAQSRAHTRTLVFHEPLPTPESRQDVAFFRARLFIILDSKNLLQPLEDVMYEQQIIFDRLGQLESEEIRLFQEQVRQEAGSHIKRVLNNYESYRRVLPEEGQ